MDFASFPKEQRNYFALSYLLVNVGTSTLRSLFDEFHPPENLHEHLARSDLRRTLRSLLLKGIIPFSQWQKLYPLFPSSVTSENFDMSLLVVLLRNLCEIIPPITGWNNLTHDSDRSVAANICRITIYKSTFYTSAREPSVDDTTFNFLWEKISRALIELGADEKAINRLKTGSKDVGELKKVSGNNEDKLDKVQVQVQIYLT